MAKDKKVFLCNECGYDSPKWSGKCPACGAWNSFVEKSVRKEKGLSVVSAQGDVSSRPVRIDEVSTDELPRLDMGDAEQLEALIRAFVCDKEIGEVFA